jgi:hypothetical protein
MLKNMRVLAVAGLVSAVVALTAVALTTETTVDRGTRADSGSGYTQLAWGDVSTQRSGR